MSTPSGARQRRKAPLSSASAPRDEKDDEQSKPAEKPVAVDTLRAADYALLLVFVVLGAITRFYHLEDPKDIIFDETHFNKFSTWYISRHYYVDIHPPLAKLAFAAVLWFLGFKGAQEDNVRWWVSEQEGGFIGTKDWMLLYNDEYGAPYLPLRRLSAVMGVIFIAVTYLTARAIGLRQVASSLAAFMAMCELVILVQSRAILCDIFLYLFNMATIGASFAAMRPGLTEKQRLGWLGATGLLLGCAMSVKLTALGTMALVGIHQALSLLTPLPRTLAGWQKTLGRGVCRASCLMLPVLLVFFGLWHAHIVILKYSGQGDNFMNEEFRRTLITPPRRLATNATPTDPMSCPNHENTWSDCGFAGITPDSCAAKGCCWDPSSPRAWCYHKGVLARPTMGWVAKMKEIMRATWANNNGGAVMVHPFMSEWYEWPIMNAHSVPFASTSKGGQIKAQGNPSVWLGAFANFCVVTALAVLAGVYVAIKGFVGCISRPSGSGKRSPKAAVSGAPRELLAKKAAADGEGDDAPAHAVSALPAVVGDSEPLYTPPQGWVIPGITLWCGYLLNLVPYMGISRSKFVYHYIPALMVAVLLTAYALEGAWCAATAFSKPGSQRRAGLKALAAALSVAWFAVVAWGFWYWAIPFGYGQVRLDWNEMSKRKWNPKW